MPTLTDVCPYVFGISDMDIGDVNGDGHGDIVITGGGNLPQTCLVIFPGIGGGEFGPGQVLATYQVPTTLVVTDINTDGRDDIVVLHSGWLRVGVYIQRDDGTLSTEALYPIPFAHTRSHNGIAVGDFTGDGCPDVAIADDLNGLVTLRGIECFRVFANGFD